MIKPSIYKKLSGRIIDYMSKLLNIKIFILDPKKHCCLVLYIQGPYGFVKHLGSWEDIFKHIVIHRSDEHAFREHMSPEEIDLQLNIRGY